MTQEQRVAAAMGRDTTGTGAWGYFSYRATPYAAIRKILRRLRPAHGDGFLDLGCGAGRVACVVAQLPFRRIIGLEIDPKLQALAMRNAAALRHCKTRPEIVLASATSFDIPEEITIVFFYNPFRGEVMQQTLRQIVRSHDRKPRRLRIAYFNPEDEASVQANGRLREIDSFLVGWRPGRAWRRTKTVKVYEVVAQ